MAPTNPAITAVAKNFDDRVGERVRTRRLMAGMTQDQLAEHLGLTFQQVQKYEKGSTRISAGRLAQIANIFGESIAFFYPPQLSSRASENFVDEFAATSEGVDIIRAAFALPPESRRRLARFLESLS